MSPIRANHRAVIEPTTRRRPPSKPRSDSGEAPTAYIYGDVLDEIRFNGSYSPRQLAAGLLVGRHFKCPEGGEAYVEISAFVGGTHASDVPALISHLRGHWKIAGAEMKSHFPDDELVGWYLAASEGFEPESPEQMDQEVYMLHNTFLQQPWQVGLWVPGPQKPPLALSRMSGRLHGVEAAVIHTAGQ